MITIREIKNLDDLKSFYNESPESLHIVKIGAPWCGPCRMLGPVFEEVSAKYEGKARFVKVNVDSEEAAAIKYGISSIPNVLVFKGGKKVDGSLGFVPAPVLAGLVDRNL